jgi:hypothetical protein
MIENQHFYANLKPLSIPFVFGGDGASLCIPNQYVKVVKKALVATRIMAREQIFLSLRVGIVPCSDILQSQYLVLVAECQISEGYYTFHLQEYPIYSKPFFVNDAL